MIVYQSTKASFCDDVFNDVIDTRVLEFFKKNLNRSTTANEISSWKDSMQYMERIVRDSAIPDDCGVAIEYQLPQSGKRVDFILTGLGEEDTEYCVIIELKRWSEATLSEKDAVVNTYVGGRMGEHPHPSYQAWSYASLLQNFNQTVEKDKINLQPCAYLHNYLSDNVIQHDHYKEYTNKAPVFLKGEAAKLKEFIKKHIKKGDKNKILYRIENGKIVPSKMLADNLVSMLKGNQEFVMIDDQKIVYETGLAVSKKASSNKKQVLIVKGGPGTGKSVVAINLLVELTKRKKVVKYISKTAAPRAVYASKLANSLKKVEINNLFTGSGSFTNMPRNAFHSLIIDEAHRLNEKSGLYGNLGEHQVKELISSTKCSIFFIDEDQKVTLTDIGTIEEIKKWALRADAELTELELASQFRCNGSDGYLAWLDNALQIRKTVNPTLAGIDYDIKVISSPNELREMIIEKNRNNKARMVAGYCWKWNSKKNPKAYDVIIPEHDFQMRWNLITDGSLWIISPDSVNEIGCIHTCQGLEVDYIGVVIGKDMIYRDGEVLTCPEARAKSDRSIFGYKKLLKKNPEEGKPRLEAIIKNTYRTLMTRGMKGCYIYCEDKELGNYIQRSM